MLGSAAPEGLCLEPEQPPPQGEVHQRHDVSRGRRTGLGRAAALRNSSTALGRASPEGMVSGGCLGAGGSAVWAEALFLAASFAIRRKNSAFLANTSLCSGETKRSEAAFA